MFSVSLLCLFVLLVFVCLVGSVGSVSDDDKRRRCFRCSSGVWGDEVGAKQLWSRCSGSLC